MLQSLPSFPYPEPSKDGFWNPVTSTINWCEEDYYATIYAAEIVNTLTNLLFIALGIRGIRSCIKEGHDFIFMISFIGYLLVGSGSFLFHATLKYPMQLVDELSMIYTTCLMCYATFSFSKSRGFSQLLAAGLVGLSVFITLYYHYLQDPNFHQNAYAILTAIVLFRSIYVMEINLRPSLRAKHNKTAPGDGNSAQQRILNAQRDKWTLGQMWLMIALGLSIFLGGFGIWTLDNIYCSKLRTWRHDIGLPWGLLLEGHGWWHLMTGTGAYFYITWGIWLRHCLNNRQDEYTLKWPSIFLSLPEIVRTSGTNRTHTNNHSNGTTQNGQSKKLV